MIKRLFAVITLAVILASGVTITTAKSTDCEHYFVVESIAGVNYLVEYNCDGSMIAVTVIDD